MTEFESHAIQSVIDSKQSIWSWSPAKLFDWFCQLLVVGNVVDLIRGDFSGTFLKMKWLSPTKCLITGNGIHQPTSN